MKITHLVMLCSLLPMIGRGASVLQVLPDNTISVEQDPDGPWGTDEYLCVVHQDKEIACGNVIESNSDSALVQLKYQIEDITEGDRVQFAPVPVFEKGKDDEDAETKRFKLIDYHRNLLSKKSRYFENELEAFEELKNRYNVSLGTFGIISTVKESETTHYKVVAVPMVDIEFAASKHVSLALIGGYSGLSEDGLTNKAFEGLITVNYYGTDPFDGPWIQFGAGIIWNTTYKDASKTYYVVTHTLIATLGWRFISVNHLNLGVAAGIQHFFQDLTKNNIAASDLSVTRPVFQFDVGFAF